MRRTGGVGALDNKVKRDAEGVSVMKQEMRSPQSKLSAQSAARITLGGECLPVSVSEDPGPASSLFQREKQDGRGKDEQMATCGFLCPFSGPRESRDLSKIPSTALATCEKTGELLIPAPLTLSLRV